MSGISRSPRSTTAFTLVELMVSIVILGIMVLMVAQVITWVTRGWSQGRQLADNLGKGRAAIELISHDLELGVFRPDLGAFTTAAGASSTTGGNFCFFVARNGGGNTSRNLTLVNYYVDSNYILERQVLPVSYSNPAASPVISLGATSIPQMANITSTTTSSQLLNGVVAFQMYFINSTPGKTSPSVTSFYRNGSSSNATTRAIGVAMVIVDDKTQSLLVADGKFPSLVAAGWTLPADLTHGLGDYWQQNLNNFLQTSASGYPKAVRTGIRVFETVVLLQSGSAP